MAAYLLGCTHGRFTIPMLYTGGVTTMEYATLIFALPVTVIAHLVLFSFLKVLRMERAEMEGRRVPLHSIRGNGGSVLGKT